MCLHNKGCEGGIRNIVNHATDSNESENLLEIKCSRLVANQFPHTFMPRTSLKALRHAGMLSVRQCPEGQVDISICAGCA
jgi:hypothetical protein